MSNTHSESAMVLNPITLSFSGSCVDLEPDFLRHYYAKSLTQMRFSLMLGICIYALFGILDAVLAPTHKFQFWLIRTSVIAPMMITVVMSHRHRHFQPLMQPCLAALILICGMGIIIMIVTAPQPVTDVYYAGLILVIFIGYTFVKARFIWALAGCWILVLLYQIAAIGFTHTPLPVLINNNFFFVGANVIGMFAAYSIEKMERRDFFLASLLQEEKDNVQRMNAELEERVQERTEEIARANRELVREIEERKKTERELRLIRSAIEQASESVVITDADARIQYVNPAFERISGYRRDEVNGLVANQLLSNQHDAAYISDIKQKMSVGEHWAGRLVDRNKRGHLFEVEATIASIRDDTGRITHHVSVQRDMTQESELKRQLRQAQKMEAIGSLAGGIAHDFNNILVPIIGHAEIGLLEAPDQSQLQKSLKEIIRAASRAKDLVSQILAFSRQSEIEFRPTQIHIVAREAIRLLRASIPPSVDIVSNISKTCGPVMGDPSQIHQVIMNLATNAYHAMADGGGTMTIDLEEVTFGDTPPEDGHGMPQGTYACLSVEDTGCGVDKTMIDKIFDPYFTTKPQGEGTGLGLSVVHGIVTRHTGRVFINSTLGRGSRFSVYLPCIDQPGRTAASDAPPGITGGSESILVVDDEEANLGMFKKMLNRLGYAVSVARSATEALSQIEKSAIGFDMVITDYAMPQMNGIELAETIKRNNSQIPVLLCTGVSEALSSTELRSHGISDILLKPVFRNELDAKIRQILGSDAVSAPPADSLSDRPHSQDPVR
ncbi:MAG: response regulator [Desulfobacterales bacterium]|jgi:PAS domain S-box-containing protein